MSENEEESIHDVPTVKRAAPYSVPPSQFWTEKPAKRAEVKLRARRFSRRVREFFTLVAAMIHTLYREFDDLIAFWSFGAGYRRLSTGKRVFVRVVAITFGTLTFIAAFLVFLVAVELYNYALL